MISLGELEQLELIKLLAHKCRSPAIERIQSERWSSYMRQATAQLSNRFRLLIQFGGWFGFPSLRQPSKLYSIKRTIDGHEIDINCANIQYHRNPNFFSSFLLLCPKGEHDDKRIERVNNIATSRVQWKICRSLELTIHYHPLILLISTISAQLLLLSSV